MSLTKYWRVILEPEGDVWATCRDNGVIAIGYPDYPDDKNVRRFRDEMSVGDKVVAYLKERRIGGLGTIIGEYSIDDVLFRHHWRTRKVLWRHRFLFGEDLWDQISEGVKAALGRRDTVVELDESQYEEIERIVMSL